ncbi:MAG: phosphoribosylanthranilate isomerase [Caulobacterales bacterium]|nr:phosphoribosylanthranilate isomerase [Caulobacterales bacterium]
MTQAKICGVNTPEVLAAAVSGGAGFIGLVSFERSPRHLSLAAMQVLLAGADRAAKIVVLTVDADEAHLQAIRRDVRPDYIQLHGAETPERAHQVRDLTGAGIIKALAVSDRADLDGLAAWDGAADHLLFDARPPQGAARPGGLGQSFDWTLLAGLNLSRPWFLAGGLAPDNVAEAIRVTGAPLVDVSSGVERTPGVKEPGLIHAFLDQVRDASPRP